MDNNKNNKKEYVLDDLIRELDAFNQTENKDYKKIADVFCRIQNINNIKDEEIRRLFMQAVELLDKNVWMFLIEIYSKFYNRKYKKQKTIIQLIERQTEKKLEGFMTASDINSIVLAVATYRQDNLFKDYLDNFNEFRESKGYSEQELVTYLYVALLIATRRTYPAGNDMIAKIERGLFIIFAEENKSDPLFIKNMKKSLITGKFAEKFKEVTYLYDGVDEEIAKLKEDISLKENDIASKSAKIENLNEDISQLNDEKSRQANIIEDKEARISELEKLVTEIENRNEFNENLYRQQFFSLKRSLSEKLKKEIQLELDGLEDISDTLSDKQKEKVQRRIDRIYKIIQKIGD